MLEKMLQDLLAKALPPEVMAMMTAENIAKIFNDIRGAVAHNASELAAIRADQAEILALLRPPVEDREAA